MTSTSSFLPGRSSWLSSVHASRGRRDWVPQLPVVPSSPPEEDSLWVIDPGQRGHFVSQPLHFLRSRTVGSGCHTA
jgi:hypothetical protein